MPRQSLTRSTTKHVLRTQCQRFISDNLNSPIIKAFARTALSQAINLADKKLKESSAKSD